MNKLTHGFTLIETMVAITILTLSIVGPMLAADRAIVAANTAEDQLTASYLAQEGIEYIRGVRDDYFLATYPDTNGTEWSSFLSGAASQCEVTNSAPKQACTLDALANTLTPCTLGSCTPLYINNTTNIYTQLSNGGTVTPFTRTIQLVAMNGTWTTTADVQVVSKVSWTFHSTPYTETIIEDLTPWQ